MYLPYIFLCHLNGMRGMCLKRMLFAGEISRLLSYPFHLALVVVFFVECVFPIAFSSLFFPWRTLSSIFFLSTFFSVAVINAAYFLMRHINWLGGLGRGRGRKSNQCISLKIPCHVHSIWPENNVILIVSNYFDLEKLNSSK